MRIAVDVDEVLAKLLEQLVPYHNEHFGTNDSVEGFDDYDLENTWNCTRQEAIDRVVQFAEQGGYDNLELQYGAQAAIQNLAKEHTLVALTSRFDFLADSTEAWLHKHFPGCFSEIFVTNFYGKGKKCTKAEVCIKENIDVLIEDDLVHVFDVAAQGVPVLLFNAKWNQHHELPENITRVYDWEEALKKIVLLQNATSS